MLAGSPLNAQYLALIGATAHCKVTTAYGMAFPRKLLVTIDCMPLSNTTPGATDIMLFGKKGVGWYFGYESNQSSVNLIMDGTVHVTRNVTTKTSDTGWAFGSRSIAAMMDDASTVVGYENGNTGSQTGTWTTAQASYPLTTDANPIYLGKDSSEYTQMRFYEAMLKINGIVVGHWRPKKLHSYLVAGTSATAVVIPDLSGYGNDMQVVGTEGTDFYFGDSWAQEAAFTGKESVG